MPWMSASTGLGLIPAGAGQTNRPVVELVAHWGSSPRVRGRRTSKSRSFLVLRLIPAGAGQTGERRAAHLAARAHPRGCGADERTLSRGLSTAGSSPRVRGRHLELAVRPQRQGLIPAGAGQTSSRCAPTTRIGAHPRGCGADVWREDHRPLRALAHPRGCGADRYFLPFGVRFRGSSPRVRGRHSDLAQLVALAGLIPAGAGQT